MNCERCSIGMASNLMNDMCGIEFGFVRPARASSCAALSGLVALLPFTQGVALGWFVDAPSGRLTARRLPMGSRIDGFRIMSRLGIGASALAVLLFASLPNSFAAESRLADTAEKSDRTA